MSVQPHTSPSLYVVLTLNDSSTVHPHSFYRPINRLASSTDLTTPLISVIYRNQVAARSLSLLSKNLITVTSSFECNRNHLFREGIHSKLGFLESTLKLNQRSKICNKGTAGFGMFQVGIVNCLTRNWVSWLIQLNSNQQIRQLDYER